MRIAGDFFYRAYPIMLERVCAGGRRNVLQFHRGTTVEFVLGEGGEEAHVSGQDMAALMAFAWGRVPENIRVALLAVD